jgi:hypothetical protein
LNKQVQALQQTSSGHQASTSQDDEPSIQSRDSHSDGGGEGEHEEPSVEELSRAIVNARVPTEVLVEHFENCSIWISPCAALAQRRAGRL